MTDLSNRIMAAWLKANPEPSYIDYEAWNEWAKLRGILYQQINCQAYESAVIQFLLPDRCRNDFSVGINPMTVDMGGKNFRAHVGGWKGRGSGPTLTEALLNAIIESRQEK